MTVVTRDVSAADATPVCPALANEAGDGWASTVPFHP